MKMVTVDGAKLRALLYAAGISQRSLATSVGVTHFNVNRWCQRGSNSLKSANAEKIATAVGVTWDEFLGRCGVGPDTDSKAETTTPAERHCVESFRRLSALDQAKVLIAIDQMLQNQD